MAPVISFTRQFTVRPSTAAEAACFSGRMKPGAQSIIVIDHVEGDEIYVVAAGNVVVEDTGRCARRLCGERVA